MTQKKGLIECDVGEGLFEGEKIISFKTDTNTISAIVNQTSIIGSKLQVDIYEDKEDKSLIGIPGETFSSARKIWIEKEKITSDFK
jgi:hypothetical protein